MKPRANPKPKPSTPTPADKWYSLDAHFVIRADNEDDAEQMILNLVNNLEAPPQPMIAAVHKAEYDADAGQAAANAIADAKTARDRAAKIIEQDGPPMPRRAS